jgi:hypothetical protein
MECFLEPREIIRQFAAIEEIIKKKTKRFFDSSRGSLDPLLMISQTPAARPPPPPRPPPPTKENKNPISEIPSQASNWCRFSEES